MPAKAYTKVTAFLRAQSEELERSRRRSIPQNKRHVINNIVAVSDSMLYSRRVAIGISIRVTVCEHCNHQAELTYIVTVDRKTGAHTTYTRAQFTIY